MDCYLLGELKIKVRENLSKTSVSLPHLMCAGRISKANCSYLTLIETLEALVLV